MVKSLVLFASGKGSNVQAIIDYFNENDTVKIALIVCNKVGAGVIDMALLHNIPLLLINKESVKQQDWINTITNVHPDLIVLAGYLWKIPPSLIEIFNTKIINLHPALLPKYGGKGMYGMHVHNAVIAAGEKESGITIHYVNEQYDEGNIIIQAHCKVLPEDTPETLAQNIHTLEHYYLPRAIEFLLG